MDQEREIIYTVKSVKKPPDKKRYWRVLYTQARTEKKVFERLGEAGIKTYLPLYTTIRQWSDRKKKVTVPLFNSYIFVHVNESERLKTLDVYGVVRYVQYLGKPALVRQKEIDAIKRFLKKTEGFQIRVEQGDQVEIATGPMEGVYGKVIRISKNKLILRIEQLNMSLIAEVDKTQVRRPLRKEG